MILGYARVSTDGQSLDAQVKQLRAAGAEKVLRETASGAKIDRAQLRRALDQRRADGDAPRPAGAINPRLVEHAGDDPRQGGGLSFSQ
jgi:DNA invertase Pin-like site-specific DNA recombinase